MQKYKELYLPDSEQHMIAWLEEDGQMVNGLPAYQFKKYLGATKFVRRHRHALDIGAHCGLWTRVMLLDFHHVTAFEPVSEHIECWEANITDSRATLHPVALGAERRDHVHVAGKSDNTGARYIVNTSDVTDDVVDSAPMRRLDDFGLKDVDFIKIDCEGFELFVLRGGIETLRRCRPVVVVEQKPGFAQRYGQGETGAVVLLQDLGAVVRARLGDDYVLSWDFLPWATAMVSWWRSPV